MTITEENAPIVILSEYEDGLALAKKVYARYELYGYVDKDKNVVIPFSFETAHAFKEGMAVVRKDGKYGYINTNGDLVIPCIYYSATDFNEGVAHVFKDGHPKENRFKGFIDKTGEQVIKCKYEGNGTFVNGFYKVANDDKYSYMNLQGKLISPFIYEEAYDFNEGVARVKINNKYGFINECGKIVIPNIFNSAINFKDGKSRVRILDRMFYIDKNGNEVKEENSKRFMKTELLKRKRRTLKAISKKDLIERSKSKSYTLNNNIKNN